MNIPEWFQDPRMKDISPDKLTFLLNLAKQIEGKNQKQAMPVLMGAVASASRQNLQFTPEEFQLIFEIMKEGKSPEEKKKMDEMLKKARGVMKGKGQ
ncbi:MAG: hypothetical protein HFI12_03790 [Lachnospiraceae bacterium]|jgi:hypothetical protein|nr:hypothetical protein [Lachnospiraceae bacterium]